MPIANTKFNFIMLFCIRVLGAIHTLRHTLRGGGGQRSVTLCVKREGGRGYKFCDITFQK